MITHRTFRKQRIGKPPSAAAANAPLLELDRVQKGIPGPGMGAFGLAGGLVLRFAARSIVIALTGSDGIPARNGMALGTGTVTEQGINIGSSGTAIMVPSVYPSYPAYHLGSKPVQGNTFVLLLKLCGLPVVIWEDCPAS